MTDLIHAVCVFLLEIIVVHAKVIQLVLLEHGLRFINRFGVFGPHNLTILKIFLEELSSGGGFCQLGGHSATGLRCKGEGRAVHSCVSGFPNYAREEVGS